MKKFKSLLILVNLFTNTLCKNLIAQINNNDALNDNKILIGFGYTIVLNLDIQELIVLNYKSLSSKQIQ
ncbi:MAG: hypothetical protein HOF44_00905 [Pelagibacterales bacterium]|nr:hypothetical protein [Pelagibacterales bacterium]